MINNKQHRAVGLERRNFFFFPLSAEIIRNNFTAPGDCLHGAVKHSYYLVKPCRSDYIKNTENVWKASV